MWNIEMIMDIFKNYIELKICDIFLNLFCFFNLGNWGNWNMITKNNFQFIELINIKIFLFK